MAWQHNDQQSSSFSFEFQSWHGGRHSTATIFQQRHDWLDAHVPWFTVQAGYDLEQYTNRPLYAGYLVDDIGCRKGDEYLQLSNQEEPLRIGEAIGGVDEDAVKRQMIRRTIEEHLDKELRFNPLGIKVLSLFFIDVVENYRHYDSGGVPVKGKYAEMFEAEYKAAAAKPKFRSLFKEIDLTHEASEVHDGYFSIDKKGKWQDTDEGNQTNRDSAERAYNLIMKDKEKLLGFETKLKFIFSHSALREGWDNPNVFQICALREMGTERERRQTIGRGLRLCVNQSGERQRGFEVNTLTVVATESYEDFAFNLQKEIEADTGIRFGIVEKHQFAAIAVADANGDAKPLGVEKSEAIWTYLKGAGLVDAKGKVQDSLRTALKDKTFTLPDEFASQKADVSELLKKLAGGLTVKNADDRKQIKTRQAIVQSAEFKALWDRIKHKTTYRVMFDNEALIVACIKAVTDLPVVMKTRLQWRKADLAIGKGGVGARETASSAPIILEEQDIELPDLLTELQDRTQLTRRSLVRILTESDRLDDFKKNPQQYIDLVADSVNRAKRMALVDGIKYQRIGDEAYYAQELFNQEELTGYLKNMLPATKAVYEYVVYDSGGVEKGFAEDLEKNDAVKVYAKLPGWFRVPTPLGTYNPDWAVLVEVDGAEKLYFVVETKSSLFDEDLRDKESAKIKCGKAHFEALSVGENPATYMVARNIDDLMAKVV
jgi:type III restriction enzyme